MAKYIIQEMPRLNGLDKNIRYPRLVVERCINLKQVAQAVADKSTFGRGEVEGLIAILVDTLSSYMALGYSVRLDGLGYFSSSLAFKDKSLNYTTEGHMPNALSIAVRSIRFRPSRDFVSRTNRLCQLERSKTKAYTRPSEDRDKRLSLALERIATQGYLHAYEYVGLTGLSSASARRELKKFLAEGLLGCRGRHSHRVYIQPD